MRVLRQRVRGKRVDLRQCAVEAMESRLLLSATAVSPHLFSQFPLLPILPRPIHGGISGNTTPAATGATGPSGVGGLSVAQLRGAYGLGQWNASNITFNGVQGDGSGQIIAIVDVFDDPNLYADLQTFDAGENLPNPPSFTVLNEYGQATPLPTSDVKGGTGSNDWAGEESLDVQWAHAMAPGAGILVIEVNSAYDTDLFQGDATAAAYPGVAVVSNSFGGSEPSNEVTAYDPELTTPSGHNGVTFLASTGDTPAEVAYPAESPNVVAVGGTQLTVSGNNWSSETPWYYSSTVGGGGGPSAYESQPNFQAGTITATKRETPDISIAGGQNSGSSKSYVPVVDSWDYGTGTGWTGLEGTSWSCPMIAGMVAVADQGRVAEGLTSMTSSQTLTRLYQLSPANFHDITTGSNGHAAVVGYDEASGIGTPIANLLIPDIAGTATVSGQVFVDNGGNGIYGGTDTPLPQPPTVYLDLNNDGKLDNGEPYMVTNSSGGYIFTDEPAGGSVRLSSPNVSGYALTSPAAVATIYGTSQTVNFTYQSASKIGFTTQPPASTPYGSAIASVVVSVETSTGSTVYGDNSTVTLTLSSGNFNTGTNTVTATAVNGVATFTGLRINALGSYSLAATDGTLTGATSNAFSIVQATPTITWPSPASITYGTALSSTQLDATANVPGTFVYTPAAGTVLNGGAGQTLRVAFTPTDSTDYTSANGSTTITVTQATPTVSWSAPASITYGTALSSVQLNATASLPGTFVYTPAAGTVLGAGAQNLSVVFHPTDSTDYANAAGSTTITVLQATPTITWANPASIHYGTALSATQLNASTGIAGTYVYTPAAGTVLTVGAGQTLSVVFHPTDTTDYKTASASASITVLQTTPTITWPVPASITYGTALGGTQLNASTGVAGTFVYSPAAGTVLGTGTGQILHVTFTPTDSTDYNSVTGSTTINVLRATPTIAWANPADISYGTPLSGTQLDANANVAGNFVYTPATGTVLSPGNGQSLGVVFTPTDTTDYTTASAAAQINVSAGIQFTGSGFYLRLDNATPQNLDIWDSASAVGAPAQVLQFNSIGSISISANANGDTFTADFSDGSVVPAGGLSFSGSGVAANNSLTIIGTGGSDTVTVPGDGNVYTNAQAVGYSAASIGNIYFAPGGAGESLSIPSGTVTLAPGVGGGVTRSLFNSITIASGAKLVVPTAASHANRTLLQTTSLSLAGSSGAWTGALDLNNNDLDVSGGSLGDINSQVALGEATGNVGIISSAAPADATHLTTLGAFQTSAGDVLVKYTYYGDANNSGQVDSADYTLIDAGYLSNGTLTGWGNGDFNYDGVINGSDYTLIDNAFNQQGASLAAHVAQGVSHRSQVQGALPQLQSALASASTVGQSTTITVVAAGIFDSGNGDDPQSRLKRRGGIR